MPGTVAGTTCPVLWQVLHAQYYKRYHVYARYHIHDIWYYAMNCMHGTMDMAGTTNTVPWHVPQRTSAQKNCGTIGLNPVACDPPFTHKDNTHKRVWLLSHHHLSHS